MIAKKKSLMPDKITLINLVWFAMIATMLTATVTLYQDKPQESGYEYHQITGRYPGSAYY